MEVKKKGFTLTEVLIVIVLIGVLIGIAVPSATAIRKRINQRLYSEKKKEILTAAELYAKDKGLSSSMQIYVYTLINEGYVKADVSQNSTNCTGDNTGKGCVINPVDDSSMNNENILIQVVNKSIKAIWNGSLKSGETKVLIETVKKTLSCTSVTPDNPCLYTGENPNNYIFYSGIMWRVIGVYNISGKEVAKLITDDNVTWEISA